MHTLGVESQPYRMPTNRVPMMYAGGQNIDRFRRETAAIQSPEDWVGSMTALVESARRPEDPPETGISVLADGRLLSDAVGSDPDSWLGPALAARWGGQSALLVKLLDAGVRLPVHFHPSRDFAAANLASPFGKTEAWVIMAESPGGDVWLGFKEEVSQSQFQTWIDSQAVDEMLARMNRLPARPGSVFYVPAGVPHAIGPGVMMTELQEPTAFSIFAEHDSFGINADEATLRLGWPVAISAADLTAYGPSRLGVLTPAPRVVHDDEHGRVIDLLGPAAAEFFGALRVELDGVRGLPQSFLILVVESGSGALRSAAGEADVRAGDTWLLPYASGPVRLKGELKAIACFPPGMLPSPGDAT